MDARKLEGARHPQWEPGLTFQMADPAYADLTFPGDPGQWGDAQYTPDGSKLIVVYQDGTGFVWPVSLRAWEGHACAVAGRNFTREEWSRFVGNTYSTVCAGRP